MLRDRLHAAATMEERDSVRKTVWEARRQIRQERQKKELEGVLRNLAGGGWGANELADKHQGMTALHLDGGRILTRDTDIAEQAAE